MTYIYAAAGGLILLFILLIFRKEKKELADFYVIVINVLISLFMLADVLVQHRLSSFSIILQNGAPLLLFPVFVLYILQFIQSGKKLPKAWLFLFLPFVAFMLLSIVDHYLFENYNSQALLENHFNRPSIWYQILFKGSQISFILLLSWLIKQLKRFEKKLKEGYSSIETVDVKWLQHFTWIYLAALVITFILFLSQNLGLLPFEIKHVFGIVYSYQGIQHYTLAQVYVPPINPVLELKQEELSSQKEKTEAKKALNREEELLEQEILNLIESKKLYLEPKFSLDDLAKWLGRNRNQISKVINAKEGRTFFDLINAFRVNHLKAMMHDPQNKNYTILAMGLDSGFNSKASLNRIFKTFTGLTPKGYLEKTSQTIK